MPPVAYAYARYSSLAQASGGSVDRQITPLKEFSDRTGVEVKEIIIDEGVSSYKGKNVNKGKFKEILDRIDSGVIRKGDYIVVESIDRITRQRVLDGVELLQGILRKGIRIYTTSDRICYSRDNEEDDFNTIVMISLIAKRANEESATKSFRRKDAWKRHKELAVGGVAKINVKKPPYGLAYDESKSAFVVNEAEADEIRRIFSLLKYMGVSNAIREVNGNAKRKWANRHVMHLIDSQYPLGVLRSQKRTSDDKKEFVEYIEGYYPPILSQSEFNEAIAAMKGRRDRKDYGNTSTEDFNIFRSVIKCGCCGGSLLFEKQKNPKGIVYFYLHCYSRKELKGACDQRFRFDLAFGMLLLFVGFAINSKKPVGYGRVAQFPNIPTKALKKGRGFVQGSIKIDPEYKSMYLSAVQDAHGEFVDLFSGPTPSDIETTEKLARVQGELNNAQGEYERYVSSIARYEGDIPIFVMKKLSELEKHIAEKNVEIESLIREVDAAKVSLPVYGHQDVVELFRTKSGRLELNRFFVAKKIRFEFQYHAGERKLDMKVFRDGLQILQLPYWFTLHKPLERFNLPNLAEFCGA